MVEVAGAAVKEGEGADAAFEGVTIAVDALGGDNAPAVVLAGVEAALAADPSLQVLLTGPDDVVSPFAAAHERCEAVPTTEFIDMDEHPAQAVRKKKDSSIVVGCRLVKEGRAAGFFSAGSTGACMTAATLGMGRIKGIARPAIVTVIPSPVKPIVLCDVGANADCKPEYLVQFAQMGVIYCQKILGRANPTVALLNIGSEDTKGSQFAQQCFAALKAEVPQFAGNAEGGDIIQASFDVIVTDGFTGNIALKTIEGTSKVLLGEIKKTFMSTLASKIAGAIIKPRMGALKDQLDANKYGGAPLLGVKGACVIGHGSTKESGVKNGIALTAKAVREDLVGLIADAAREAAAPVDETEGGEPQAQ